DVQDCQGSDLVVTKTAVPSFKRTYTWSIDKKADTDTVYSAGGDESGPANYTVSVSHDAGTDSAWKATGNIHIVNPNDWEAITLTHLTDAVDNGGTCTPDAGPYVVPAGGSIDVGYTCTYASAPAAGTNTATATWDASAAHTPDGSASGTAGVSF